MLLDRPVHSVSSCPDEGDSDFSITFSSAAQTVTNWCSMASKSLVMSFNHSSSGGRVWRKKCGQLADMFWFQTHLVPRPLLSTADLSLWINKGSSARSRAKSAVNCAVSLINTFWLFINTSQENEKVTRHSSHVRCLPFTFDKNVFLDVRSHRGAVS